MAVPPSVPLSPRLRALLLTAERSLARLDGALATLPDARPFTALSLRREAASSSVLAGAPVTLEEFLSAEAGVTPGGSAARGVTEAANQLAALEQGLVSLRDGPVSAETIRNLHARLLGEGRGGPGTGASLQEIDRHLGARDELPDLIRIGLIHARLLALRPFPAGTGRVGRLLVPLLLVERGVLRSPVLHLSGHLRNHRRRYHALLNAARERHDQEGWLTFFLEQLDQAATEAATDARSFLLLLEGDRTLLAAELGRIAGTGLRVLASLLLRPVVSVHEVQAWTGTTYAAANSLVARLEALRILVEITGNARNRRFRYDPFVRIFSERGGVEGRVAER